MNALKMNVNAQKILAAIFSISLFLLMWQAGVQFTDLKKLVPGPMPVFEEFVESFFKPIGPYTIVGHLFWSITRVMVGFILASASGILLGLAMGWNRTADAIFKPLFEVIRPIPPIAWISISLIWFGFEETSKWFIIFLSGFANVLINVYTGAKAVDPVLIGAAQMLGAKRSQLFTTIVIPSSMPYIFSGLQIAVSSSWAAVVAAEMVHSTEGVGWMIISGMSIGNTTQIMVGIIAIGIFGYLLATIMRKVEMTLCRWTHSRG